MALEDINLDIEKGSILGLIGYNGVGKTTLLKTMSGLYTPDQGGVYIEDENIYENSKLKKRIYLMSEDPFLLPQSNLYRMRKFYKGYYNNWSDKTFEKLIEIFDLNINDKIESFSKGMKRQAGLILALSTRPDYLFLDEAFDGLDLFKRNLIKDLLKRYVEEKNATVVITSHNLNELEDISDTIAMIKNKKLVFKGNIKQVKERYRKYIFSREEQINLREINIKARNIIREDNTYSFITDEDKEKVLNILKKFKVKEIHLEKVSLEEIFLSEKEEIKYEFNDIF